VDAVMGDAASWRLRKGTGEPGAAVFAGSALWGAERDKALLAVLRPPAVPADLGEMAIGNDLAALVDPVRRGWARPM
jgi:hypothetical protein